MRARKVASSLGEGLGLSESPKTWRADSRQACESFASDRLKTLSVIRILAHLGRGACVLTGRAIRAGERTWRHFRIIPRARALEGAIWYQNEGRILTPSF